MNHRIRTFATLSFLAAAAAAFGQLQATLVATDLDRPTGYYAAPGGNAFITQKEGQVIQVGGGTVLDFSSLTDDRNERGLLGMAFDPNYATNNQVYFSYVSNTVDSNGLRPLRIVRTDGFDLSSAQTVIDVPHPAEVGNHWGGTIRFADDGMLYISMGDGGNANDPEGDAQNLDNWLGKILRIDVSGSSGYKTPSDNPFNGNDTQRAIWAYGLRNPYKFSFDPANGDLYIGDVGQDLWEEVDRIGATQGGANFGWPGREGPVAGPGGTVVGPVVEPIHSYDSSLGGAVIAGAVYRGSALGSAYVGRYFFGDFINGTFWSIDPNASDVAASLIDHTSELGLSGNISSIDTGVNGELFVTYYGGSVYQVVPEPASLVALGLGVAACLRRRKPRE